MEFKQRLRTLWRDTSKAEQTLWQALQNPQKYPQLGEHQFSRHVVVGDFYVDFVCAELKLAIELDGGQTQLTRLSKNACSTVLQYKGYLVVRVWQKEILSNLRGVLERLGLVLCQRRIALNNV